VSCTATAHSALVINLHTSLTHSHHICTSMASQSDLIPRLGAWRQMTTISGPGLGVLYVPCTCTSHVPCMNM
jgi:hypothetical protein